MPNDKRQEWTPDELSRLVRVAATLEALSIAFSYGEATSDDYKAIAASEYLARLPYEGKVETRRFLNDCEGLIQERLKELRLSNGGE